MKKSKSSDILLVPSAILVPDELRLDVGSVPTGMVPLEGRPMLERIAQEYADRDVNRVVAVDHGAGMIRRHIDRSEYEWTVVDVPGTRSLAETIVRSLESLELQLRGQRLYLNFADTLVTPVPLIGDTDYISYKPRDRTYRWTSFQIIGDRINGVSDKYQETSSGTRPVFSGQFGFTDAAEFRDALVYASDEDDSSLSTFYRALLAYLRDRPYELTEPDRWLDVGHLDTYHHAKKQYLNTRNFNELHVDTNNVITKRSDDTGTLINEIKWYIEIPTQLQPYLPRVYEWSVERPDPFIRMEYVGYPSLSDLQLYGSHGQHIWNGVFHRLFSMLKEFSKFTVDTGPDEISDALRMMYVEKTRRRLDNLRDDARFARLFDEQSVIVNGEPRPSIRTILGELDRVVEEYDLLTRETFSIIHGDLCFPNVLYDPRNEILKLIDPRGSFGEFSIYGDVRYDLAKLRHSASGHYEHLINDQFSSSFDPDGRSLSYDIYTTDEQVKREQRFDELLVERSEESLEDIKLIEAFLWLSMVPLHSDRFDRQLCMLGQGLEKIDYFLP